MLVILPRASIEMWGVNLHLYEHKALIDAARYTEHPQGRLSPLLSHYFRSSYITVWYSGKKAPTKPCPESSPHACSTTALRGASLYLKSREGDTAHGESVAH